MSFELFCGACGAASGPSVGTCPFCKSILTTGKSQTPAVKRLTALYNKGNLEEALLIVRECVKNEKYAEDCDLMLLCVKVLFETEGPSSQIKSLLAKISLVDHENTDVTDYMSLLHAKTEGALGRPEQALQILGRLLQRSPNHVQALFLLGVYQSQDPTTFGSAIHSLEKALSLRPNFLRAWGCLAAIARKLDHPALAERALKKCVELETNGMMKQYFLRLLDETREQKAAA